MALSLGMRFEKRHRKNELISTIIKLNLEGMVSLEGSFANETVRWQAVRVHY